MLSNTLNTNEIKNSSGAEVEFSRLRTNERQTEFAQIGESPALPHRISIAHTEQGSGLKKVRRSVVRVDKTIMSTVDTTTPVTCSFYIVGVVPVGAITAMTEPTHTLAELLSFCASNGADSTIKFDGSGTGASVLLSGGL